MTLATLTGLQQPALQPAPKPALSPRTIEARQLAVTLSQSAVKAAPLQNVALFVDVVPKPAMHVYAPEQTGGYIRITLELDKSRAFTSSKPRFPKASDYYFAPLQETFKVFDAPFRIRQDIAIKPSGGVPVQVTGTLRYQACDDAVCYRPDEVRVAWTIGPAGRR